MKSDELNIMYEKILQAIDIPVIVTTLSSKGLYPTGKIYIRKDLEVSDKIKVLLHEYTHHVHITKYYENESRAECEMIAEGTAFFVSQELGLELHFGQGLQIFVDELFRCTSLMNKARLIADDVISWLKD